jgi:hypothetical protein
MSAASILGYARMSTAEPDDLEVQRRGPRTWGTLTACVMEPALGRLGSFDRAAKSIMIVGPRNARDTNKDRQRGGP